MTATRAVLPAGVRVAGSDLVDDVRQGTAALNASAAALLNGALGDDPDGIVERVSTESGVAVERIRADLETLVVRLNVLGFVNLQRGAARAAQMAWLRSTAKAIRAGVVPRVGPMPTCRTGVTGGVRGVPRGLAGMRGALLRVLVTTLVAVVLMTATTTGDVVPALALAMSMVLGIALHELAHLVALGSRPAAVLTTTLGVRILHPPLPRRRRRTVALVGPLVPASAGLVVLALAGSDPGPALVAVAIALVMHVLNLLAVAGDGRAVLEGVTHRALVAAVIGAGIGLSSWAAVQMAVHPHPSLPVAAAATLGLGALNAVAAARDVRF